MNILSVIPREIKLIINDFKQAGYQAYIVGGCVRDILLGEKPKDWDLATNAKPNEVEKIFLKTFCQNDFFTVTILTQSKNDSLKEVQVTTFRSEASYSDKRHPDQINFAQTIEEDLSRRDFTINAIAIDLISDKEVFLIDPFSGQRDIKEKIIKTVGKPEDRLNEDALRMLRAIRFAVVLNFQIEEKTGQSIKKNAFLLENISKERIRDELMKIIISQRAVCGIDLLKDYHLLKYIIPELEQGCGVSQNKHHIYDCYEHNLKSFEFAVKKDFNYYVRLAALLHDIAKPFSKRGRGANATFYGHEIAGARMTEQILKRLRFPKKDIEKIVKLVRYHLFYYNVDEVSEGSVRRLVRQVGIENMEELLQVRMADRIGSGVPKAEPYKLRHLRYIIEKVSKDPISVKMLKLNGKELMNILKIKPGPKVGQILDVLLGIVLADPKKNKKEFLKNKVIELGKMKESDLKDLTGKAKKEREQVEFKKDKMSKEKYWVS